MPAICEIDETIRPFASVASQWFVAVVMRIVNEVELRGAIALFAKVCRVAGSHDMLQQVREGCRRGGLTNAVAEHDNALLFEWLISAVSYQGVSDAAATTYMNQHGRLTANDIADTFLSPPSCPKLRGFWAFERCGFHKGSATCSEPEHMPSCPLPAHDMRNGRLNQTAYSLHLFLRDLVGGDLVSWIDVRLKAAASDGYSPMVRRAAMRASLLQPLGQVYGVSNKVLSMALADLLLGADPHRPLWVEAGGSMIAIDSLVHNWLHRSGILSGLGCDHPYGARCYGVRGCAEVIEVISASLDARQFNPEFPIDFPRFVQKAIWRFCAQAGLDQCNGNRVDDRYPCAREDCELGEVCGREPLKQWRGETT